VFTLSTFDDPAKELNIVVAFDNQQTRFLDSEIR
jgi:hypothetical protein